MTKPERTTERHAPIWTSVFLTLLGTLGLVAVAALYVRLGTGLLARMDVSVGEVLMEEGIRFEDAGSGADALARYRLALDARFQGPQNRAHTLERVGALLRVEGDYEAALPHLQQAASSPYATLDTHLNLADTLIRLERNAEAEIAIQGCLARAEQEGDSGAVATATYYVGRLALAQGDLAGAEACFAEAHTLQSGGEAALALGRLCYDRGDREQALELFESYLTAGATGARADAAYEMRQDILTGLNTRRVPSAAEPE